MKDRKDRHLSRREFLKIGAAVTGGVVVAEVVRKVPEVEAAENSSFNLEVFHYDPKLDKDLTGNTNSPYYGTISGWVSEESIDFYGGRIFAKHLGEGGRKVILWDGLYGLSSDEVENYQIEYLDGRGVLVLGSLGTIESSEFDPSENSLLMQVPLVGNRNPDDPTHVGVFARLQKNESGEPDGSWELAEHFPSTPSEAGVAEEEFPEGTGGRPAKEEYFVKINGEGVSPLVCYGVGGAALVAGGGWFLSSLGKLRREIRRQEAVNQINERKARNPHPITHVVRGKPPLFVDGKEVIDTQRAMKLNGQLGRQAQAAVTIFKDEGEKLREQGGKEAEVGRIFERLASEISANRSKFPWQKNKGYDPESWRGAVDSLELWARQQELFANDPKLARLVREKGKEVLRQSIVSAKKRKGNRLLT